MSVQLKKKILKLLEEDTEFRYMVAGYIGYTEILRNIEKIWIEIKELRREEEKIWESIDKLWENTNKLWEGQNKLWEEVKNLRLGQEKIWEEIKELREGQNKLWIGQEKLWENANRLLENINKLWEEVRNMKITLDRVAITIDRITISIEEEALSYIRYRLRNELGIEVSLDRLFIDTKEINIYGVVGDFCIIGEAAIRLGVGLIEELVEKIKMIKSRKPNLLRPKLIKVIYTDYATPDALEYAKENNIWVLKWSGDLTSRVIEELD